MEYFELEIFWCENILKKIREIDFFLLDFLKLSGPLCFLGLASLKYNSWKFFILLPTI